MPDIDHKTFEALLEQKRRIDANGWSDYPGAHLQFLMNVADLWVRLTYEDRKSR